MTDRWQPDSIVPATMLRDLETVEPDWNGGPTSVMSWIEANEPRLYRAVLVNDEKVILTPFVALVDKMPPDYTLGMEPKWVTERIAVLRMMPLPPPPHKIDGIGMRVDQSTFWIIAPEDW